jgi:hypothetical protein
MTRDVCCRYFSCAEPDTVRHAAWLCREYNHLCQCHFVYGEHTQGKKPGPEPTFVTCAKCGSTDLRVQQEAAGTAEPATGDISPGTSVGDRGTPAHPERIRPVYAFCVWNNHTGQTKCLYCGYRLAGFEPLVRVCDVSVPELADATLNDALGKAEHMERKLRQILSIAEETTWGDPAEAFCKIALHVYEALGTTEP